MDIKCRQSEIGQNIQGVVEPNAKVAPAGVKGMPESEQRAEEYLKQKRAFWAPFFVGKS